MMNGIDDIQKMGQQNLETSLKMFGEWNKAWQGFAMEMGDYAKRSFEDGTATFEKLMSVKSLEQALEIQQSYAKRSYDGYMQQMSKLGNMYVAMAKDACKPMEAMFKAGR